MFYTLTLNNISDQYHFLFKHVLLLSLSFDAYLFNIFVSFLPSIIILPLTIQLKQYDQAGATALIKICQGELSIITSTLYLYKQFTTHDQLIICEKKNNRGFLNCVLSLFDKLQISGIYSILKI